MIQLLMFSGHGLSKVSDFDEDGVLLDILAPN